MIDSQMSDEVSGRLRVLQFIAGALIAGCVIFGVVVAVMALQAKAAAPSPPTTGAGATSGAFPVELLRIILVSMLVTVTFIAIAFQRVALRQSAREFQHAGRTDPNDPATQSALFGRFFIARLIGLALIESAALFGCIVALLSRNPLDLAIAAVAALFMIMLFPTTARWREFLLDATSTDARFRA